MVFADRDDAGRRLTSRLGHLRGEELLGICRRHGMRLAGTVLLRRGEVAGHFLLLTSGRARVAFGQPGARKVTVVAEGSILGEMALLRGTRRSATVIAMTGTRGLKGGRTAFTRLLAIPGSAGEGRDHGPPASGRRHGSGARHPPRRHRCRAPSGLPRRPAGADAGELFSATTRYQRFLGIQKLTSALARYLTEVDYVDHFAWVVVDSAKVPVGGVAYVRSARDRALADISLMIEDEFQGRGLGTLLVGAVAIAARRNGIARLSADILAENASTRAILARAGIRWEPAQAGVVHGVVAVPDPGMFGITPGTAAALAAVVEEMKIRP